MARRTLLPGLLVAAALGSGVVLAAGAGGCGGTGSPAAPQFTSGGDASLAAQEGGPGDDGSTPVVDAEAGPPVVRPRVYVVHAAQAAPPLRFCLGVGSPSDAGAVLVGASALPLPDVASGGFPLPALYPGFAGALDDEGQDLSTLTVDVFALDATNPLVASSTAAGGPDGAAEIPCAALIGGDGLGAASDAGGALTLGRDYWLAGTIPAGQLAHGSTSLALVTDGVGLSVLPLDVASAVAPGALGAQFVQASSAWQSLRADAGGVTTAAIASFDAGHLTVVAADAGMDSVVPPTLVQADGVLLDGGATFLATVFGPDGGPAGPTPLTWPLAAGGVQEIDVTTFRSGGALVEAGPLALGDGYVFVLAGDPSVGAWWVNAADGGPAGGAGPGVVPNGRAVHVVALPVANP